MSNLRFRVAESKIEEKEDQLRGCSNPSSPLGLSDYERVPPELVSSAKELLERLKSIVDRDQSSHLAYALKKDEKEVTETETITKQEANKELMELNPNMFEVLAIEDKQQSMAIQRQLMACDMSVLDYVATMAQDYLSTMVFSNYGCYVLTTLCSRSRNFTEQIEQWCLDHFYEFVVDEFATRVLQSLAEVSVTFRVRARDLFLQEWNKLVLKTPAGFFLTSLVENAGSWLEIEPLFQQLLSNTASLFHYKRYKKSAYEICASPVYPEKERLFHVLAENRPPLDIFGDKYLSCIIRDLALKGHNETILFLVGAVKDVYLELITNKHFKALLLKIAETDSESRCEEVFSYLIDLITGTPPVELSPNDQLFSLWCCLVYCVKPAAHLTIGRLKIYASLPLIESAFKETLTK